MSDTDLFSAFKELDDSEEVREDYIRAPLTWPGSKYRFLDKILPILPYRKVFVDVFGGSGSVILNRKPSELDVYNDRFGGVVAFYRCLRDKEKMDKVIEWLENTVHSREEFIWCKETWENSINDVERAAKWYYMTQTSFSGLGRAFARQTNSKFTPTVHKRLELFPAMHERLKTIQIENLSWKQCMKDFDGPRTVFYLDPPYLDTDTGCYRVKFTADDHKELVSVIKNTTGYVALSGYDDNYIYNRETFWDNRLAWEVTSGMMPNAFTQTNNQKEDNRVKRKVKECLWIKS